jgi:hypothetical protein
MNAVTGMHFLFCSGDGVGQIAINNPEISFRSDALHFHKYN